MRDARPRPRRHRLQAQELKLSLRALAGLAQDEEPGGSGGEARRRRGLGEREVAVTNDRPWRLADLTFVPSGSGRERATINGVRVVRQNGRYWIMTRNGPQW